MTEVNRDGAASIAEVCREAGVRRLIHVSSLLASSQSRSRHQQSKLDGEAALKKQFGSAVIVRPSAIFGHEDRLLNLIGLFSAIPFGYPVVHHGKAVRHPLYVGDFAEAIVRLCKADSRFDGKTFDLIGPEPFTLHQLTEYFAKQTFRQHPIINLPPWAMLLYSRIFPEWRRPVFTMDLVRELLESEQKHAGHLGMAELGIAKLQTLDDMALGFIRGFRPVYAFPNPAKAV